MRISVDRERCVGAGQCVLTAPAVFDQDDDGRVLPLTDRPDDADADAVREAVDLCPSQSLSVADDAE